MAIRLEAASGGFCGLAPAARSRPSRDAVVMAASHPSAAPSLAGHVGDASNAERTPRYGGISA